MIKTDERHIPYYKCHRQYNRRFGKYNRRKSVYKRIIWILNTFIK